MKWKIAIKQAIPAPVLNRVLLAFPSLYRTRLVNFETNISPDGIEELIAQLDMALHLDGNIIECGSSRCGASVLMARHLQATECTKGVYACDSFEGFDRAELKREKALGLTTASDKAFTSTSYSYVEKKLAALGVADRVLPVKGYFQQTLPRLASTFCFALIDCDFRDSLVYCAETIWPRLACGGRILFDDYTSPDFRGARLGVDYFIRTYSDDIEEHGLLNRLYFVKKRIAPRSVWRGDKNLP